MSRLTGVLFGLVAATIAQSAAAQEDNSRRIAERQNENERQNRTADDWRLYLSSGVSFSTRETDDDPRTDYYRFRLGGRVAKGPFRVSATLPYIVVKGPGAVIGPGDDDEIDDLPATEGGTRDGWGDLRLTARYRLPSAALAGFDVDLLGSVKLPTASTGERLGTGEVDYAVGGEISRDLGSVEPFVAARYRINGDRPDQDYRNTVATSVGASMRLSRRTEASLGYDYSQSRIRGRSGVHSVEAGVSTRLSRRLYLSGSASAGLSQRAPDYAVGTTMSWRAF